MTHWLALFVVKLEGRDHLGDLRVDGRIIVKLIIGKRGGRVCTVCFRTETGGGLL